MPDPMLHLFDEVRLLDHRLVQVAQALHAEAPVSVPGRAVLEFLHRNGPATVPEVARARYVTRQHIQAIVDGLLDGGFVATEANPAHRRSSLVALTPVGEQAITAMHARERQALRRRLRGIDAGDVRAAAELLAAVRGALDDEEGA